MDSEIIPTSVVGSYPQPDWLVDRDDLRSRAPPRVRARNIWRIEEKFLEEAQDDATLVAIKEMESVGIDIITDGEIRRESYSNCLAVTLDGMDMENPGVSLGRTGRPTPVPRIVGPIRWRGSALSRDAKFLVENASKGTKITLPGPFTLSQQAQNEYYPDDASLAKDLAVAVNKEAKVLKATGVDVIQIDEPYLQARLEKAEQFGVEVINRALEGLSGPTAIHTCFGYAYIVKNKPKGYPFLTQLNECVAEQISIEAAQPNLDLGVLRGLPEKKIILGVIDLEDSTVESPEKVAGRIRSALKVVPPNMLIIAPDDGMKYLERGAAVGKLRAMVEGTKIVRSELA